MLHEDNYCQYWKILIVELFGLVNVNAKLHFTAAICSPYELVGDLCLVILVFKTCNQDPLVMNAATPPSFARELYDLSVYCIINIARGNLTQLFISFQKDVKSLTNHI